MPRINPPKSETKPIAIGTEKFRMKAFFDVRRQTSIGPTPVMNRRNNPIGVMTLLKKGAPTVIFVPVTASEITGKIVPQNTAKQIITKMTLLNKNPLSRDVKDSILLSDLRSDLRYKINPIEENKIKNTYPRKRGPRLEAVNEWTEDITPLRVKKVPKIQSENVNTIKTIFQILNISFFSWIIIECRKAVPVNQGMKDAFSTGSQAQ